jgi:DNA-binding CsgD family transcriptional regulator
MTNARLDTHLIPKPIAPPELTAREVEVLSFIAKGMSSKDAAEVLFLSKRTVDFHLRNIYGKLHVRNRVQAFYAAQRLLEEQSPHLTEVIAEVYGNREEGLVPWQNTLVKSKHHKTSKVSD